MIKLSQIKVGDICVTKNGNIYILCNPSNGDLRLRRRGGYILFTNRYNEKLERVDPLGERPNDPFEHGFDIINVYRPKFIPSFCYGSSFSLFPDNLNLRFLIKSSKQITSGGNYYGSFINMEYYV